MVVFQDIKSAFPSVTVKYLVMGYHFSQGYDIIYVLRDLVTFVLFKKHEKHPWRSVTFSKLDG